ncbi:tRNA-splicing endonuclease subunit Sen2 [Bactrocera neohumeralis]|uniref:tRNA-splicing endonuclease subunit Sen2 n=1 Tax=Bactrocera neohumeralis TaxID=98809 RepID=UPI0021662867|nr:tRNA-splicing endonuclease subunit Sen2 [Bactrocera neohumeralis]
MLFTPIIKQKKGGNKSSLPPPLPDGSSVIGVFTGISVEVCGAEDIRKIYENGFFGKGSKSRGAPKLVTTGTIDDTESLSLELEESAFLAYFLGILRIHDIQCNEMQFREFLEAAKNVNSHFLECLGSYLYLKSKGWVIKSGIKFGGNFLIYKRGPRYNHASFIIFVHIKSDTKDISIKDLKGLQRIAETSDKDVLLLEVSKPNDLTYNTISDIAALKISETIIRRFNSTSFVQSQKITK